MKTIDRFLDGWLQFLIMLMGVVFIWKHDSNSFGIGLCLVGIAICIEKLSIIIKKLEK